MAQSHKYNIDIIIQKLLFWPQSPTYLKWDGKRITLENRFFNKTVCSVNGCVKDYSCSQKYVQLYVKVWIHNGRKVFKLMVKGLENCSLYKDSVPFHIKVLCTLLHTSAASEGFFLRWSGKLCPPPTQMSHAWTLHVTSLKFQSKI